MADGGFCSVIRPARDASAGAELAALYVTPARWRQGVGRALVKTALSRDEEVTLWVFAQNGRARSFYATLGFVDDDAQAVDPGTGVPEVRMRRPARRPRDQPGGEGDKSVVSGLTVGDHQRRSLSSG